MSIKHALLKPRLVLVSLLAAACVLLLAPLAGAQSVIKRPGAHPDYSVELEPHLAFAFFGPYDNDEAFGPGFRATIELVDNGFIQTINNTVGIGFGLDWLFYDDHRHCYGRGRCTDHHDHDRLILPVVMQWNFWLHEKWSVFGEPGFALEFRHDHHDDDDVFDDDDDKDLHFDPFVFYAGGRFHFTDAITLTMRVGYPYFSVGVSFLL